MKNYTITVNGTSYDVVVEEKSSMGVPSSPKPVAVAKAPEKSMNVATPSGAGKIKVESGAAGKVFKVVASVGQALKKGDTIIVIEAMKMEIPVVAPEDGTVVSIDVTAGSMIESKVVVATLN